MTVNLENSDDDPIVENPSSEEGEVPSLEAFKLLLGQISDKIDNSDMKYTLDDLNSDISPNLVTSVLEADYPEGSNEGVLIRTYLILRDSIMEELVEIEVKFIRTGGFLLPGLAKYASGLEGKFRSEGFRDQDIASKFQRVIEVVSEVRGKIVEQAFEEMKLGVENYYLLRGTVYPNGRETREAFIDFLGVSGFTAEEVNQMLSIVDTERVDRIKDTVGMWLENIEKAKDLDDLKLYLSEEALQGKLADTLFPGNEMTEISEELNLPVIKAIYDKVMEAAQAKNEQLIFDAEFSELGKKDETIKGIINSYHEKITKRNPSLKSLRETYRDRAKIRQLILETPGIEEEDLEPLELQSLLNDLAEELEIAITETVNREIKGIQEGVERLHIEELTYPRNKSSREVFKKSLEDGAFTSEEVERTLAIVDNERVKRIQGTVDRWLENIKKAKDLGEYLSGDALKRKIIFILRLEGREDTIKREELEVPAIKAVYDRVMAAAKAKELELTS